MKFISVGVIIFFFIFCNIGLKAQWTQTSFAYEDPIWCITINGNNIYAGTEHGVILSSDNGTNWTPLQKGPDCPQIYSISVSGKYIFIGTWTTGIFRSSDNGATWINVNNGRDEINGNRLSTNGKYIFAGIYDSFKENTGIWRSSDYGLNWKKLNMLDVNALAFCGNNIFVASPLSISTNYGATWVKSENGIPQNAWVHDFAVSDSIVFAATDNYGIYRSTDKGLNWNPVNNGIPKCYTSSIACSGNVLIAGTDSGVFYSGNKGDKWTRINNGLPKAPTWKVAVGSSYIYAGHAYSGIWRRPISDLANVVEEVKYLPQQVYITNFYTNVSDSSKVLEYNLLSGFGVEFRVYNESGKEVKYYNEKFKKAGKNTFNFITTGFPNGIYLIKLEAGPYSEVRKMVVFH